MKTLREEPLANPLFYTKFYILVDHILGGLAFIFADLLANKGHESIVATIACAIVEALSVANLVHFPHGFSNLHGCQPNDNGEKKQCRKLAWTHFLFSFCLITALNGRNWEMYVVRDLIGLVCVL
jgi:TRAP-type uncharacterized transport system fused permease subunit